METKNETEIESATNSRIREQVHHLYYDLDINCARTTMLCLSELYCYPLEEQTLHAAIGMHGAGGYRAQCGLVEGALMFMGAFLGDKGKTDAEISDACRRFAEAYTERFGSLKCFDLRPGGFNESDPPHICEGLTAESITFTHHFISGCI